MAAAPSAAAGSLEATVTAIWVEVLGLDASRSQGDFFEQGGHSLVAAQIVARLNAALGIELTLRELFQNPTIPALTSAIERWRASAGEDSASRRIRRRPRDRESYPLSFPQRRLWFMEQWAPGLPTYNMPGLLWLHGTLDVVTLGRSLDGIVRRQEMLRTVFDAVDGEPFQRVREPKPLVPPLVDLAGLGAAARRAEARRLAEAEARTPFDLAREVLRTRLLRLDDDDHALLVNMHHIVSDGWSMQVFVRELGAFFPAMSAGRPALLPELPIQYLDFAAWQREQLRGEALERRLSYWRRQLAEVPAGLELPTDGPWPAVQGFHGARRPVSFPRQLSESVHELAARQRLTLFVILLAGVHALLYRYTGQCDICVGSPVAGRSRVETEGLIGFFVNTLVLRIDLAGELPFSELLARERETFLGAEANQDVPFEVLIDELQPARDLSRSPFFQVLFVLQTDLQRDLSLPGLDLAVEEIGSGTAKFELTLSLADTPAGLIGWWEHNTDLFDPPTIARMTFHLHNLLAAAVADPGAPLSRLPILTTAERQQLVVEPLAGVRPFPADVPLHRLFERQAARAPAAVAVTGEGGSLTYAELDDRAGRLAARLRRLGVGTEVRVALWLDRTVELVVAILGVLKAGGAYVPVDPSYPEDRLRFLLQDADAPVLVSVEELCGRLAVEGITAVLLDRLDEDEASLPVPPAVDLPESTAYVIYTSGSTGKPKGVPVSHANVARLLTATAEWFGFGENDVWTLFHSYAFDFSVWELWGALLYGGRLVVVPYWVSRSPEAFYDLLRREQVTVLNQTPSAFHQLSAAEEQCNGPECGELALRWVIFGGEALEPRRLAAWFARHGDRRPTLVNMYGITETTVHVTFRPLRQDDLERGSVIGVPIPDLYLHVLDGELEPVPLGVAGEVHVGGAGLARGYLDRPELSAERFVPDPFALRPGARLYASGDLARRRPDSELEYLGRADQQVKIRGFRVELGEIEAALSQHPSVREVVVLARDGQEGQRLVAWLGVGVESAPGADELRRFLKAWLPEHMIPAVFVPLENLPLTAHGKIDRRALPEPAAVRPELRAAYVAPRTPVEEVLAGIWAEVLGLERVGAADHFFDLGGHSLLATQVMSRLRGAFDVEIPLRDLFAAPTLADLATRVEAALRASAGRLAPPLVPVPREGPLPLSFAQQRLWFIDQFEPGTPLYNMPVALRVEGPLDCAVLALTLAEIVHRHEALRTVFTGVEGSPVQVIRPAAPFLLPVVDLSGLPESTREALTRTLSAEEAGHPFDLTRGPFLRGVVLRRAAEDHVAALTMHHIASDGWSMGILVREVTALYTAFAEGRPSPLPELPVQYADFAVWQRSWLQGEILESEVAFWRRQLAGLPPLLELPTDRPRPATQSFRGTSRPVRPAVELPSVEALSRREGATLFMVLLAGFQALLARYSGQRDLAVGSPVAGRNRVETEGLIGFFVNTLVLRADLTGGMAGELSFRELLGQVRETTLAAHMHQDVPFEKLVQELSPVRSLAQTPLFQVMFVLQNAPLASLGIRNLRLQPMSGTGTTAKFDLTLSLAKLNGELVGTVEHATDLFDTTTIDRFMRHFETLLSGLVAEPDARLSEVSLFTPHEQQQMREWNTTPPIPASEALHRRFEAQARRTPDAVALIHGDLEMTYAAVDARADQLAHHLRQRGVRTGTAVGICLERSCELVISLLGTLKAGACYVPLDPAYPSERWAPILADSGIRVLLTQEHLLPLLPAPQWEVVCVDRDRHLLDACSEQAPPAAAVLDAPLYVIYTSGSTGRPKGVAVLQRAVLNLFDWYVDAFELHAGDSFLLIGSIGFDMTQKTVFAPLLVGGRLIIPLPGLFDPAVYVESVERHAITRLNCTPSTFYPLLEQEEFPRLASLRGLSLGGEPISSARLERWRTSPWCRASVINTYGPTECTDLSTWHRLEPPGERDIVPIGRPLTGVQVWLLSRGLVPVPVGVTGCLCAAGNVALGYLGQPAMTAEKFLPNPFSGVPGDRMYWVGDLARWLPTGELEYLGRADFQIKLRGFRIEPGEIEAALSQHPAVEEVVILARGKESLRLVAWLAVGSGPAPGIEELRSFLKALLPEYMIPSVFVLVESLPLTPNGKIDRQALPEPDMSSRPELEVGYVAPRTPQEAALAAVWTEVLGVDRVGVHDNFFALGGDSIRSVRVLSLARARGLRFSLPQLFRHQTIAQLIPHQLAVAEAVATPSKPLSLATAAERAALPPDVEDAYPVSALQLGMLFHSDYGESATTLYHNVSTVRLSRALDTAAFRAAAAKLTERHPVLRTSFDLVSFRRPLQLVHRAVEVPVSAEDLSGLSFEEQEAAVARRFEAEKAHRFALDRPLLLRFHVQHLGAGETQLFWTMHHVILDGWSLAVLLSELFLLYEAELGGTALPPPPVSTFRDFIALEREVLESEEAQDFWQGRLHDIEPARLLRWHPEEKDKDRTPVTVPLPGTVLAGLRDLATAAGVPLKNVFLAAHVWVIGRMTGTRDVVTGLVTNGRPEVADADRILGLFLNTVPLRTSLPGGTWLDLAHQMLAAERELLPFRRYPLPEIRRDLEATQLFETSFNYINFYILAEIRQASGTQLAGARSFGETSIPLAVDFIQDTAQDTVALNAQRDPVVVNRTQLHAIVDLYLRVLAEMATAPASRYDAAGLLSPTERQQILHEWNDTALVSHLESEVVHEVFERWAALIPDAPALLSSPGELSYRELNRRANRIARRLQADGAGPEVAVGLYTERSAEMIAGLLGILKAGAAYVPLDPAYPRERLLLMIEDVHMPLVLTQERLAGSLAGLVRQVITVDNLGESGPEDDANPRSGAVGDNLAYAIFTSGSTGRPKPVGVSHRALTQHMAGTRQVLHMAEHRNDRVLQFSTLNFDGSVDQVFIALVNGGCLALREEEMWSAEELEERIGEMGLTIIDLPTGYWSEWVRARSAAPERAGGESLRVVYVGGEAMMSEELAVWWRSPRNRNVRLLNAYGPTETVVAASFLEATSRESAGPLFERVAIGHPLRGRALHVVDPQGRLAPVGVSGELLIAGEPILARGYLGRPALTAERFHPDPFSPLPGARLYRTGDLGRYLPDGRREFLGRVDDQVKVRGFRIELGEVEAALAEHPAVHRAAAVVHGKGQNLRRLVAYLAPVDHGSEPPTAADLRAFLRGKLPEPMVPSDIVFLDRLPLTANGKVDRRALPAPELSARRSAGPVQAPRSDVELQLAGIWEELLEISPIGVTDDFLELGGHSLLAVRLMARIEHVFGVKLPISTLFEAPTVERLAAVLRRGKTSVRRSPLVQLHPGEAAGRPLFVVHPVGGDIFAYVALAKKLGVERPIYGLQALPEAAAGNGQTPTMEELAAQYLAAVREIQATGPYLLAGWSLGAVIAYEMAQQIEAAGATVALLVMIDPSSPASGQDEGIDDTSLLVGFAADLVRLSGRPVAFGQEVLAGLDIDAGLDRLVKLGRGEGVLPPDVDKSWLRERFDLFSRHAKALQGYVPHPYGGQVTLFRASESLPPGAPDPALGWSALARAEAHVLEADHYSLLRSPVLDRLVEHLQGHLARIGGKEGAEAQAESRGHGESESMAPGLTALP